MTNLLSIPKKVIRNFALKISILLFLFFSCSDIFAQVSVPFNSSGSFTVPAGVTGITVACWGGGGAGGGVDGDARAGGGGEGGSFVRGTISVIPGQTYIITVGSGGEGYYAMDGDDGSPSSVRRGGTTYFNAIGGEAGKKGVWWDNDFGSGGNSVNTGNIVSGSSSSNNYGGKGGTASNSQYASSGGGGGSAGAGGNGGNGGLRTGGSAGSPSGASPDSGAKGARGRGSSDDGDGFEGDSPGAGGSGARNANDNRHYRGGDGGVGLIIITYTITAPTISGFSPSNGCADVTSVVITGTNFTGATSVTFGRTNAASFIVNSSTKITAIPSTGSSGSIKVTTSDGTATSADIFTVNSSLSASVSSTPSCVGGSTGTISVNPSGGGGNYTYSLNGGAFKSNNVFEDLGSGSYNIDIKSSGGCTVSVSVSTIVSDYNTSTDNQNTAGTNTWIGHIYDGTNFNRYIGYFSEPETFDEDFGGSGTCFEVTSNSGSSSVYTETYSVAFKMNSTRKGLYIVDLGSDDGSRLTIDGDLVYNNWSDQSYSAKNNILISLTGNSSLKYEFYENGGANRSVFQNIELVFSNTLSGYINQSICMGEAGSAISGNEYASLPSGVSKSGTGYQWSYSTTPNGTRIDITGATAATFTPNTLSAPFNAAGTYYVYRKAILKSTHNTGFSSKTISNESNPAIITINAVPSASISYANAPFCNSSSNAETVSITGTTGGVFSGTGGMIINSFTGSITPDLNPVGSYTVTYTVTSAGCSVFSTTTKIYIGTPGTWSGKINSDWNNSGNWICGGVPNSTTDAIIPKTVANYPNVISNTAEVKNLYIQTGASLIITGTIKVAGSIRNSGNFNVSNGTLEMNGTSAQTISGNLFENKTVKNLVVSNSGSGLSVSPTTGDTLKITGLLSFGNPHSQLNTGDNITLVSNSAGTASVGILSNNNSINGKATVERYVNTGTEPGQHGKSWQFLSTPTEGQTIKQSWMENGSTPDNYGIMISGPAGVGAGFDLKSAGSSMKVYNYLNNNWDGVSGTNIPIYDPRGYMVFVRGDRSVTGVNQASNSTVLRTKGTLLTGALSPISVAPDHFQSIGNPYAAPVDFTLINKNQGVDDKFYVWDPYLYGSYGLGGYQVLSSVNGWEPVPGGTEAYPSNVVCKTIQSGQAFFAHATSNPSIIPQNPTITFTENSKAIGSSKNVSRQMEPNSNANSSYLRVSLFAGTDQNAILADGNSVAFNKTFSDGIDDNDALKILNSGENFGLTRSGKKLAIEAKAPANINDTIYYDMNHLARKTYQLRFAPKNMEATGLHAFLMDEFLHTETPVSLADSTFVDISITPNAKSSAADRFKIVFRQMNSLPVTITSITAMAQEEGNQIQWSVENESGIQQYEVEKSTDGNQFTQIAIVNANNTKSGNYEAVDKNVNDGTNYYRVKIVSVDGKPTYTKIVKVARAKSGGSISVYPNPIINDMIHLQFNNQPAGNYKVRLYNAAGQVLISKNIIHSEGSSKEDIRCDNLPKGIYQLQIAKPDGIEVISIKN